MPADYTTVTDSATVAPIVAAPVTQDQPVTDGGHTGIQQPGIRNVESRSTRSWGSAPAEARPSDHIYAATRTGQTCGECGRDLHPSEPIWRLRRPWGMGSILAPVCEACYFDPSWPEWEYSRSLPRAGGLSGLRLVLSLRGSEDEGL